MKGNVFLDVLLRPPTTMTSSLPVRVSLSFFFTPPGERTDPAVHVDGSPTRECQVLLLRSIVLSAAVREGCCAARHRLCASAKRTSRAFELSSSIRDPLRPDRSGFIQCSRDFRRMHISHAIILLSEEYEEQIEK